MARRGGTAGVPPGFAARTVRWVRRRRTGAVVNPLFVVTIVALQELSDN
jgi:hypothetical protein